MQKFIVPQFIDNEAKIIGPINVRQFIILVVTIVVIAILYKLLYFNAFLIIAIFLFSLSIVFAFVRVNSQAFHLFVLNLFQTLFKPRVRVWDKTVSYTELQAYIKEKQEPKKEKKQEQKRKEMISESKLSELSLLVNTGGAYNPEEE